VVMHIHIAVQHIVIQPIASMEVGAMVRQNANTDAVVGTLLIFACVDSRPPPPTNAMANPSASLLMIWARGLLPASLPLASPRLAVPPLRLHPYRITSTISYLATMKSREVSIATNNCPARQRGWRGCTSLGREPQVESSRVESSRVESSRVESSRVESSQD